MGSLVWGHWCGVTDVGSLWCVIGVGSQNGVIDVGPLGVGSLIGAVEWGHWCGVIGVGSLNGVIDVGSLSGVIEWGH